MFFNPDPALILIGFLIRTFSESIFFLIKLIFLFAENSWQCVDMDPGLQKCFDREPDPACDTVRDTDPALTSIGIRIRAPKLNYS